MFRKIKNLPAVLKNKFTRTRKPREVEPTPDPIVSTIDWEKFERGMNRDRLTWERFGVPAPKREPKEHIFDVKTPIDPVIEEMMFLLGIKGYNDGNLATKNPKGRKGAIHPELLKFFACVLIVAIFVLVMMILIKLKLTWLFLILFYGAVLWICLR